MIHEKFKRILRSYDPSISNDKMDDLYQGATSLKEARMCLTTKWYENIVQNTLLRCGKYIHEETQSGSTNLSWVLSDVNSI